MKNIGQYNQDLSVPRKKDIDFLEARVKTNEDNIAMAESDIEGLKTDVSNVKTAIPSKTSQLNNDSGFITSESAPVKSVNSKTGDVVLNAADVRALSTSGGALTGNLTVGSASINTNGYVVGTWLQCTANNHMTNTSAKVAVLDGSGWVYYRTVSELLADLNIPGSESIHATTANYGTTKLSNSVTSTSKTLAATPYSVKMALNQAKAYTDSAIRDAIAASY